MRNLVICCDGTANEFAADKTNVVKLFSLLVQDDEQIAFYHPGLGTMEPPGALTNIGRKLRRALGRAIGWGLEHDLAAAYIYIMKNYRPGDRLFLFGFSRGAYTARALASLLSMYGLFPPGNDPLVPYAIRRLMSFDDGEEPSHAKFQLAAEFKQTFAAVSCPVHFLGVWDTVSSVGWIANPLKMPYTAYNPDVLHARHAVAIDERRAFFRTNKLSQPPTGQPEGDVSEVWFAGVHADVGGGYPAEESGLAKLALEWMVGEAAAWGLKLNTVKLRTLLDAPEKKGADAKIHESLRGWWWLAEIVPKKKWNSGWKVNLAGRRTVPPGAKIHASVFERKNYSPLLPPDGIVVHSVKVPDNG